MKQLFELTDRELIELNFAATMLLISDITDLRSKLITDDIINIVSDNKDNYGLTFQMLDSINRLKI
jgi:hypothetical protein